MDKTQESLLFGLQEVQQDGDTKGSYPINKRNTAFFLSGLYHFPTRSERTETDERDRSDSPWGLEVAALKAFPQFTRNYILHEISSINLIQLLNTIPPYRGIEDEEKDTKGGNKPKKQEKKKEKKVIKHWEDIGFGR